MKSTGIIRRVDNLGRIVLPVELRRLLDIDVQNEVEIFVEDNRVILEKYSPNCIFCGSRGDLIPFEGRCVCARCADKLKTL